MTAYTTITFKTEKKLKDAAKRMAQRLGIPLTTVIEAYLREFVETGTFCVSVHPHSKLARIFLERKIIIVSSRKH